MGDVCLAMKQVAPGLMLPAGYGNTNNVSDRTLS
jgi:hypothetical protein